MFFYNAPKPTPQYQTYTEANKVIDYVQNAIYEIKSKFNPEEADKAIAQLKEQFEAQVKHWNGEKEAAHKAIQEKLNTAKPTKVRTLTAEDVAVLSYKANILKGRIMQAKSSEDFETLKAEILGSEDEQMKQAFLDHVHEYSELEVADSGAFRRLLRDTHQGLSEAFMTDEEKTYKALQEESEKEKTSLFVKFNALEKNVAALQTEFTRGKWGGQVDGAGEGTVLQESEQSMWS